MKNLNKKGLAIASISTLLLLTVAGIYFNAGYIEALRYNLGPIDGNTSISIEDPSNLTIEDVKKMIRESNKSAPRFHFNKALQMLDEIPEDLEEMYRDIDQDQMPTFYSIKIPTGVKSLNELIHMRGTLLDKKVELSRSYASLNKKKDGLYYTGKIYLPKSESNNRGREKIGNIQLFLRELENKDLSIAGEMTLDQNQYRIYSFPNNIVAMKIINTDNEYSSYSEDLPHYDTNDLYKDE